MQAVNEEMTFSGTNITRAFRFWFDNPALDYGYALRVANNATQEVKFERWETGLKEHGPMLTLTYALPPAPRLESPVVRSNGVFEMNLIGSPGHGYSIEVSADLFTWAVFTNLTSSNAIVTISDTTAGYLQRFYRAVEP